MKQRIANYTVIIEKQKRIGTNQTCFMAFVPILGIATEADTIERAGEEIKSLIQFHLDSLAQEKQEIPMETGNALVTKTEVVIPENAQVSYQ